MNLRKLILTENACYKAGKKITPKGIMVHSTGANNPYLRRYVGPDDGLLGVNQYNNHWNQDSPMENRFVSMLSLENLRMVQLLPIKLYHGTIEGGMLEEVQMIHILVLKYARMD